MEVPRFIIPFKLGCSNINTIILGYPHDYETHMLVSTTHDPVGDASNGDPSVQVTCEPHCHQLLLIQLRSFRLPLAYAPGVGEFSLRLELGVLWIRRLINADLVVWYPWYGTCGFLQHFWAPAPSTITIWEFPEMGVPKK